VSNIDIHQKSGVSGLVERGNKKCVDRIQILGIIKSTDTDWIVSGTKNRQIQVSLNNTYSNNEWVCLYIQVNI
jgi:hypothetical protein